MPYELITERNLSEGFHILFVYVNDITDGLFIRLFIFSVWCIIGFGLYFSQKRAVGTGDLPMSLAVSGFISAILTVLLQLIPNLVDLFTSTVIFILAGLSVFWFLMSRD